MSPSLYGYLADAMVAIHVSYVAYVVVGQLLIWPGLALGWDWVRNRWFRGTHLLAIGIVEEVIDLKCPLTVWEEGLRRLAGQEVVGGTFLGRFLHNLIFVNWSESTVTALHLGFAALVLLTFVLFPPRW